MSIAEIWDSSVSHEMLSLFDAWSTNARRFSLVAKPAARPSRDWQCERPQSVALLDTFADAPVVLREIISDRTLDVERVVIDGCVTTRSFLDILANVPAENLADILWICEDESGYLSAIGRGGDRVLYNLNPDDVRFYLEVSDLVSHRTALEG